MTNIDLVAYSTFDNVSYSNIMSVDTFREYSTVLNGDTTDVFEQYTN